MRQRTIFAMGGAEFTGLAANEALHEFILRLPAVDSPRLCLLPTASGDPDDQIAGFYRTFTRRDCDPSHISLFRLGTEPVRVREHLLAQDLIYVGGGSLVNLLAIWRAHGLDELLREAWHRGIVLCGLSAGSMCWFEEGVSTGSGHPRAAPGLGLLSGSNCVHYRAQAERRSVYLNAVGEGTVRPGWGVDDHCGLLFEGYDLIGAFTGDASAGAVRVERSEGRAREQILEPEVLVAPPVEAADDLDEFRIVRQMRGISGLRTRDAHRDRRTAR